MRLKNPLTVFHYTNYLKDFSQASQQIQCYNGFQLKKKKLKVLTQ